MMNRKLAYFLLAALIALVVISALIIQSVFFAKELRVVFLDAGQGDAILIQEGNYQVLVDGGRNGRLLLEKLGGYIPFWDRQIETVIATHPDQDHIGGLIELMENYKVGTIIKTNDQSESQTFSVFNELAQKSQQVEAKSGVAIKFPSGSDLEVIYPVDSVSNNNPEGANDFSIVTKLNWKNYAFLLTGDLPENKEVEMIEKGIDIDADVLKVSHHGSKYSTSDLFLEKTSPSQAIISVGKNNMYGHPSQETLERLKKYNVEILRTDEMGDIIYQCKEKTSQCAVMY